MAPKKKAKKGGAACVEDMEIALREPCLPVPPAPLRNDNQIFCKYCKRLKSEVPWRGPDGAMCRSCPRLIAGSEALQLEIPESLENRLQPGSSDHKEWMVAVGQWELANPYKPRAKKLRVEAVQEHNARARTISGIFWPKWLYQDRIKKDPAKSELVSVLIDEVWVEGVWRTEPLDGFVPGATVFDKDSVTSTKKKVQLTLDDATVEEVDSAWQAGRAMVDSLQETKAHKVGSVGPTLFLTAAYFALCTHYLTYTSYSRYVPYSTVPYSTLFYSTLLYSTLFYLTLVFSLPPCRHHTK
jgi:hypothetical protein